MRHSILSAVVTAAALGLVLASSSPVQAADPKAACENAKLKAAGKHELCLGKQAGKAQLGKPTDVPKCETRFSTALTKADTKAAANGTACRYIDNGDGTVSDLDTGLMWQQSDDNDGLTDKDNTYAWSAVSPLEAPNGTAFTEFLGGLNNCESGDGATVIGGYGGHCDWRIPQINELKTILLEPFPCGTNPCIDQSVFGPTNASSWYWSSSTDSSFGPGNARFISFDVGTALPGSKNNTRVQVRAVRGGS